MKLSLIIFISYLSVFNAVSQNIIFKYNFDNCNFEDATTGFPGITPGGNPQCECGINQQSYLLDGNSDFLTVSPQANNHLKANFTLDFYFTIENTTGETDIMSHRKACITLDSLMALRYFSSSNELLFEIASNVNNYNSIRAKLNKNLCWHRFTLVKFDLEYLVFVDNILIKNILSKETIIFSKLGNLSFANSPCTNNQISKLNGKIDEITLYDRALSEVEIKNNYLFPDQIVTENTTIFKGQSIKLVVGETCANTVDWSPVSTLDDKNSLTPTATPDESTTYTLKLSNLSCVSKDTVRIFVADKEKLDCNNLLIPKAFTPNNDGLNDRFGISNTFLIDKLEYFEIYDRWGAKIWETNNTVDQWDGTLNNQPVNGGMYLFKIKFVCNGQDKLEFNNFTLIR